MPAGDPNDSGLFRRRTGLPIGLARLVMSGIGKIERANGSKYLPLAFDNSLQMAPSLASDGRDTLILDWGLSERTLFFSRFFWIRLDGDLLYQHLTSYLEKEILLIASRQAALRGAWVSAREYHRLYVEHEFADRLQGPDEDPETLQGFWHFIIQYFSGWALLTFHCQPAAAAAILEKLNLADPGRYSDAQREMLFTLLATFQAMERNLYGAKLQFVIEYALFSTYWEVLNSVCAVAPAFGGSSVALGDRIDRVREADHGFRLASLRSLLGSLAAPEDDGQQEAYEFVETLILNLNRVLTNALDLGLLHLTDFTWGDGDYMWAIYEEENRGLDAAAAEAILDQTAAFIERGKPEHVPLRAVVTGPALHGSNLALGRPRWTGWERWLAEPIPEELR